VTLFNFLYDFQRLSQQYIHSFVHVNAFMFTLIINSLAASLAKKFSDS